MELPGLCPGVWSTEAANKFIEALLQDRQKEKENCGEFAAAAAAAAAAPSAAVAAAAAAPASSASGQSAGGGQRTLDDALPEHAARARQLEEQNPEPSPMPRTVYKCSVCGLPKAGHTCSGVWQGEASEAPKQPLASANRLQTGQSGLEACAVCGVSFAKGWGAFHACKGAGERV